MKIKNKVIIITGASSGIGLATAKQLASLGAKTVLAALDEKKLRELEKQLPGAFAVPTDVTKPEEAKRLVNKTIAKLGRIDVLINNAARAMAKPVEHIDIDEYRDLLELLRRAADGSLLPHVIAPEAVAEGVAQLLQSGDPELDILEN